jgi:phage terminase large subunit-like protein
LARQGSLEQFERFTSALILDNGHRMRLEAFQREMLEPFFAGTRESVALLPKSAGKTTLLAALALYELISDPDADGAVCAASRDQAGLLLRQISGFVRRTPALQSRVRMRLREALNRSGGRFRVLSADVDTGDGVLLTFAIADELHRWRGTELYSILLAGCQKRDGRLFGISTAGVHGEGLLWAMRQRALELGAAREGARVSLRTPGFAWLEY